MFKDISQVLGIGVGEEDCVLRPEHTFQINLCQEVCWEGGGSTISAVCFHRGKGMHQGKDVPFAGDVCDWYVAPSLGLDPLYLLPVSFVGRGWRLEGMALVRTMGQSLGQASGCASTRHELEGRPKGEVLQEMPSWRRFPPFSGLFNDCPRGGRRLTLMMI